MTLFDAITVARETLYGIGIIELDEKQHKMVPKNPESATATRIADAYNTLAENHTANKRTVGRAGR